MADLFVLFGYLTVKLKENGDDDKYASAIIINMYFSGVATGERGWVLTTRLYANLETILMICKKSLRARNQGASKVVYGRQNIYQF